MINYNAIVYKDGKGKFLAVGVDIKIACVKEHRWDVMMDAVRLTRDAIERGNPSAGKHNCDIESILERIDFYNKPEVYFDLSENSRLNFYDFTAQTRENIFVNLFFR